MSPIILNSVNSPRPRLRPRLMTRDEFEAFVTADRRTHGGATAPIRIYARPPYDLRPCTCGDVNCHGWRFVERGPAS